MKTSTKRWLITDPAGAIPAGVYAGKTPAAALDAWARANGHRDFARVCGEGYARARADLLKIEEDRRSFSDFFRYREAEIGTLKVQEVPAFNLAEVAAWEDGKLAGDWIGFYGPLSGYIGAGSNIRFFNRQLTMAEAVSLCRWVIAAHFYREGRLYDEAWHAEEDGGEC